MDVEEAGVNDCFVDVRVRLFMDMGYNSGFTGMARRGQRATRATGGRRTPEGSGERRGQRAPTGRTEAMGARGPQGPAGTTPDLTGYATQSWVTQQIEVAMDDLSSLEGKQF